MKYIFTAVCMLVVSPFTYAADVKLNELYPSPPKNGLIKEQIGFKQTDAKTTAIQINLTGSTSVSVTTSMISPQVYSWSILSASK